MQPYCWLSTNWLIVHKLAFTKCCIELFTPHSHRKPCQPHTNYGKEYARHLPAVQTGSQQRRTGGGHKQEAVERDYAWPQPARLYHERSIHSTNTVRIPRRPYCTHACQPVRLQILEIQSFWTLRSRSSKLLLRTILTYLSSAQQRLSNKPHHSIGTLYLPFWH